MSTRANILITDFKDGKPTGHSVLLYHHHDGDEIGILIRQFLHDIPTGDADDTAAFLKGYTNDELGYLANGFEDAKAVSSDIDYMYYVDCHEIGRKVVYGYRFPHPKLSITGEEINPSDGQLYDDSIYDKFATSRDFTRERIERLWPRSFFYAHGFSDEELGGAPKPKED